MFRSKIFGILLAEQRKTGFEFVTSKDTRCRSLQQLWNVVPTIELAKRPNVFTDGAKLRQVMEDIRNGADPLTLKKDIVSAIDPSLTPEEKAAALRMMAADNKPPHRRICCKNERGLS